VNQHINLYQPIFRRQKKVFSAKTMLQISVFFMFVFAAIYGYGQLKLRPLQVELARLERDLARLNTEVSRLEKRLSGQTQSKLLENEIARLSTELERRKQIENLLSSRALGNTRGLSPYLAALARQHVEGTWLTRISIANGGGSLELDGKTLSSELVPVYIGRLAGESLFQGMAFNVLELARPEQQPADHLNFHVRTN